MSHGLNDAPPEVTADACRVSASCTPLPCGRSLAALPRQRLLEKIPESVKYVK